MTVGTILISAALSLALGLLIAMLVRLSRDRRAAPLRDGDRFVLRPSRAVLYGGYLLALFALAFLVGAGRAAVSGGLNPSDWLLIIVGVVTLAGSGFSFRLYFNTRVWYDEDSLTLRRLASAQENFLWTELTSANEEERVHGHPAHATHSVPIRMRHLTIVTAAGDPLRFTSNLVGFDHFAAFAVRKVPPANA